MSDDARRTRRLCGSMVASAVVEHCTQGSPSFYSSSCGPAAGNDSQRKVSYEAMVLAVRFPAQ